MSVRHVVTIAVATVGFALALALRQHLDPWRSTAVVALVAAALSLWTLGAGARSLFAVTAGRVLAAIVVGALLVVATHAGFHLIELEAPALADSVRELYASVDRDAPPATLVLLTVIVVLGEELVWRGVAFELLRGRAARVTTGAISVALYVAPQLVVGVPLLIVVAAGLGTVLATQRVVTGRLIEPLLTHLVWSVSVFVVFPLAHPG